MEYKFCFFSTKTYVVGTLMDLLNETVLLKTKSTLFDLLIRETSQFLCCERLLNMTYVANKNAFFPRNAILVALLYSGFISSTI